jgi:hypothetical protein
MFGGKKRNMTNMIWMRTMDKRLISVNRYQLRKWANRHRE